MQELIEIQSIKLPLSENKISVVASTISDITKKENSLYFRSKRQIADVIRNRKAIVVTVDSGKIVGFALRLELGMGWEEISSVYVMPSWRNKGIAGRLISEVIMSSSSHLFVFTRNSFLYNKLKDHGFKMTRMSQLPITVRIYIILDRFKSIRRIFKTILDLPEEKYVKLLVKSGSNQSI